MFRTDPLNRGCGGASALHMDDRPSAMCRQLSCSDRACSSVRGYRPYACFRRQGLPPLGGRWPPHPAVYPEKDQGPEGRVLSGSEGSCRGVSPPPACDWSRAVFRSSFQSLPAGFRRSNLWRRSLCAASSPALSLSKGNYMRKCASGGQSLANAERGVGMSGFAGKIGD